jgi:hypothetical protein
VEGEWEIEGKEENADKIVRFEQRDAVSKKVKECGARMDKRSMVSVGVRSEIVFRSKGRGCNKNREDSSRQR